MITKSCAKGSVVSSTATPTRRHRRGAYGLQALDERAWVAAESLRERITSRQENR
jgi:hypothetical protein